MFRYIKWVFVFAVGLFGAALITKGLNNYPGSKPLYILFSVVFWLMLLTATGKRTHYGYLFLTIALWLGFWGKLTSHLILKYPYVEPVGRFDGTGVAWDGVLWAAIAAGVGVLLGKLLFSFFGEGYSRSVDLKRASVPEWYPAVRKWVWMLAIGLVVGIASVNLILGIQQIGLVPRTVLPWPLNALIAWQVSLGGALMLTVLLWWDVSLQKSISVSVYALLLEAVTSSVSLLSRGIYIFHSLPQLFSLFENRQRLIRFSRISFVVLFLVFAGCLVISISIVTTFRSYLYPNAGEFTTEDQKRLTRLEVLDGGIAHVKKLILQGEPLEPHLRELLAEKAQLERALKSTRLEVIERGIVRVKKLILEGESQESKLQELLAEKAKLEEAISKIDSTQESTSPKSSPGKKELENGASKMVAKGGVQVADKKKELDNGAPTVVVKGSVQMTGEEIDKIKNMDNPIARPDSLLDNKNRLLSELAYQIGAGALQRILSLAVDRWVGLEGVMAVSAYPEKQFTLLLDATMEKRQIAETTKYQEICNSTYRWTDGSKWQFASLPGAAAYLLFSGSLWVVLLGMGLFAFLLQLAEQLVFNQTFNPLLSSLIGWTLANSIAQFGITPRQDIPFYSMIFCFVILVSVVQSRRLYGVIGKLKLHRDDRGAV